MTALQAGFCGMHEVWGRKRERGLLGRDSAFCKYVVGSESEESCDEPKNTCREGEKRLPSVGLEWTCVSCYGKFCF